MSNNILEIRHLKTYFFTGKGVVKAVDGISFGLRKGENLCLVGESGCGKTATALSILRLIDSPPGRIVDGEIPYHGEDLLHCSGERLRQVRGNRIAMIFQDPQSSLNPVFSIGDDSRTDKAPSRVQPQASYGKNPTPDGSSGYSPG